MLTSPAEEGSNPGTHLASTDIPGGGQLHLVRHGKDYEIVCDDEQLMGNWATRSEKALATLVYDRLGARATRLLIGGLGMGFTLAAALKAAPAHATIQVTELVPGVVEWARGPLAHIFDGSLADPRVDLRVGDVHDVIAHQRDSFDAILLDVDNGPDCLVMIGNERLYSNWGLRAAHAALRAGGMLAVWSSYPDDSFFGRLEKAGFTVEEVTVGSGDREDCQLHTIWLATRH